VALEQAATTLNDSNAVSRTIPIFDGNQAVPFLGIWEWKMTGIPGRPGMKTAVLCPRIYFAYATLIFTFY